MKKMIAMVSAAIGTCAFAAAAYGAAVDVKPVELKPIEVKPSEVKPVLPAVPSATGVAPAQGLDFGNLGKDDANVDAKDDVACKEGLPARMAAKAGVDKDVIVGLFQRRILNDGKCGQIGNLSEEGTRHLVKAGIYIDANGYSTAADDQKDGILAKGLESAFKADGVTLDPSDLAARAHGTRTGECELIVR